MAASAKPGNPGSWNRFNYTVGDPVNRNDPRGRDDDDDDGNGELCNDGNTDDSGNDRAYDGGPADNGGGGGVTSGGSLGPDPCIQITNALFGGTVSCGSTSTAPIVTVGYTPDPCANIAAKISNTINGIGMPGGKSLLTRIVQQITGDPAQFDGHQEQIDNYTNRLRRLKNDWKKK